MDKKIAMPSPEHRQFTGWHMAFIMIVFFGLIVGVNLTMAFYATNSWTGLVVKNSYVASQQFNSVIGKQHQLRGEGWRGQMEVSGERYRFSLTKNTHGVEGCSVSGVAQRPVHAGQDVALHFMPTSKGQYVVYKKLQPGQWNFLISATCDEFKGALEQHYRIIIPSSLQ